MHGQKNIKLCHLHITITDFNTVTWSYMLLLKSLVSLSVIIIVGLELDKIFAAIIFLKCITSVNCERNLSQLWYTYSIVWGSSIPPCSSASSGSPLKSRIRGTLFFMMTWHKYNQIQNFHNNVYSEKLKKKKNSPKGNYTAVRNNARRPKHILL